MRPNGTRSGSELNAELKRLDFIVACAQDARDHGPALSQSGSTVANRYLSDAYRALGKSLAALREQRRMVELNAPVADTTAILVHRNID